MKKLLSAALAALLLVSTLGACGSSGGENGQLVLYTWENMFPQEVLDGFTQETGISVTYTNFDTDETMLARLEAAQGGDYDLVIADDYIIETAIQEGPTFITVSVSAAPALSAVSVSFSFAAVES